ncbi:carnitinyl-CoA dehydratase [Colletotrichum scovillei]|uniref:Carnitinyl-CoA dehydratase n=2 Tax=Colletotrichum acutatum species complex TaxID=2707335 RepID=A0A9P7QUQ3_9PEZI|nr:carnitinyl-CoA dehydratase [Colletotrichum scovillei]KXH52159.1 carnitinyl-CoA dehydratase [Colletotrichum nymphaeae SA-01]KAF4775687.1 carnitinyl-CoA dehydratase [Colletotrichum scovillei]KAG7039622.1 carnitinyl-CoA dehydratase [Colletotrichum scovillei]KAG7041797.1 carnitinyl-CoA dehydratase [Colletotrichum scovillei]KAG7061828.1 carnitinyl-CoA dehydratase [Colletotrichum scovillei]
MATPRTKKPVPSWIENPYPHIEHSLISFPRKHILLVTINRPEHMNCLPVEATIELGALWKWYDAEPELRCAVFTGAGTKAFCAGMDLKQRLDIIKTNDVAFDYPPGQFAGMSNRTGRKPIIVACNGHAHGGGFEAILNADVIFASPNATFRLPEVLRGVSALAGALPRCMMLFGNHRTMDLILTGRTLSVEEAHNWGLVKEIVPQERLLARALDYASEIAALSPDSVIISRLAAREAWETGVSRATMRGQELWAEAMLRSKNATEGLAAYREKRDPKWFPSHL